MIARNVFGSAIHDDQAFDMAVDHAGVIVLALVGDFVQPYYSGGGGAWRTQPNPANSSTVHNIALLFLKFDLTLIEVEVRLLYLNDIFLNCRVTTWT